MRIKQISLDILCLLILGLAVFFFASGFAKGLAEDFFSSPFDPIALFIFASLAAATATCICRLCRIHFKFRKVEKIIAIVYLCLAALSIYPLLFVSVFNTLTFSPNDSQWLITRNMLSILAMDLSYFVLRL